MSCDSPEDVEDAAVAGRWVLYVATCASERAVRVRPGLSLAVESVTISRLQTFAVGCMFVNLPAQFGNVAPPAATSCVVQLLYVAHCFVALGGVLRCGERLVLMTLCRLESRMQESYIPPLFKNRSYALGKFAGYTKSCSKWERRGYRKQQWPVAVNSQRQTVRDPRNATLDPCDF